MELGLDPGAIGVGAAGVAVREVRIGEHVARSGREVFFAGFPAGGTGGPFTFEDQNFEEQAGQIVLTPFPYTDLSGAKLRPVLLLRQASARFDDWLVCMVSSQLQQAEPGLDELISLGDADYVATGLKVTSVLRLSRLAVVDGAVLVGAIGEISPARLLAVRQRLAAWMADIQPGSR